MFKDLVRSSRSYRGYDPSYRFTREELADFVDCARLAASSMNIQPLKYALVWEPEKVAQIQSQTGWAMRLREEHLPHQGMEPTAFIIVCQDTDIQASLTRFQKDVGIVSQTILLAAAEKGLGGCMLGTFSPEKVKVMLELPEHITPMLCIALGKPAETVILEEIGPDGDTGYYRDEQDRHHVPKRRLQDILL